MQPKPAMKTQPIDNAQPTLALGDIVEFVVPFDDEVGTQYRVVELNGDRCAIELICDFTIRPTWTRLVADLKLATTASNR